MPKEKQKKKSDMLRHAPLGSEAERNAISSKKSSKKKDTYEMDEDAVPSALSSKIMEQARQQRMELEAENVSGSRSGGKSVARYENDSDEEYEDDLELEDDDNEEMVEMDDEYVDAGISEAEESIVQRFLQSNRSEGRSLADIIMEKIKSKEEDGEADEAAEMTSSIPPKVIEVYTMVGKLLTTYKSGKLPKALKMLPHLKNWEDVLWVTRPDTWSAQATYACTRIFASNLKEKMAQRFYNLILLEKVRDDIRVNHKLNYHLYMALKKALFKVLWHQSLLAFAQRYKLVISDEQRERFKSLLRIQSHHQMTMEIRRELFAATGANDNSVRMMA